ncbi:hypothetical protein GUITHDRAFT_115559 [Guillardia theta CCMP2712]|uniref:Uncharacterized protein n=1 Tax=Guillardia theta (strain CCMP2712) TaxID=905079 RepID=L1IPJ9_GUITC|nr:hypothetical protein GUITHDRAFT_115559 [Guillardia theta CCMP2712]EKX38216.1 hypothetical protein GUITHDRAFT_115559 [Guillardia theta CCMP2712]|eukprot:XP_005825196.1 hypothetical protein GUITHDRAFT_115559 [Guillardia theta CCMP2712]
MESNQVSPEVGMIAEDISGSAGSIRDEDMEVSVAIQSDSTPVLISPGINDKILLPTSSECILKCQGTTCSEASKRDPISAAMALIGFRFLLFAGGFAWIVAIALKVKEVHGSRYFAYLIEERVRQFSMADMTETGKLACGWESFLEVFSNFLVGVVAMAAGILSMVSVRLVKQVIVVGGLIDAACNLCVFIQMMLAVRKRTVMGTSWYVFLIAMLTDLLIFPLPLIRWEAYTIELIAAGSLIRIISIAASSTVPYKCLAIFVFFSTLLGLREGLRRRTKNKAAGLGEQFDQEWRQLRDLDAILKLKEAVSRAQVRSRTTQGGGEGGGGGASFTWLRRQSLLAPLPSTSTSSSQPSMIVQYAQECQGKDLDQLYAQAVLVSPLFLSKVQSWAEASDGYFLMNIPSAKRKHYLRWRDCKGDSSKLSRIKWASIKNANRAIEKILLLCNGDTSKLTDIVRQTIVFKELRQLVECVEVIINDSEVEVVRIKNRLDPDYDASTSGGYRDVGINLRVIHEGAKRWGVAGHVCELRLTVQSLHSLMDSQNHTLHLSMKNVLRFRQSQGDEITMKEQQGERMQDRRRRSSSTLETLLPTHMSSSMGYSKSLAQEKSDIALLIYKSMYPGNILDKYLTSSGHGVAKADTTSILYSSHPLKNVLHKTLFQLLLLLAGIGFIILCSNNFRLKSLFTNHIVPFGHARITFEGYVDANVSIKDRGMTIEDFLLVKDTCHVYNWTSSVTVANKVFFTFPHVVYPNGLKFKLTPALISYLKTDALAIDYLSAEGIDDVTVARMEWQSVSPSTVSCKRFPSLPLCHSEFLLHADESLLIDLRFTWQAICIFLIAVFQILCCLGAAFFARLGKVRLAKFAFTSAFHLVGLCEIFTALSPESLYGNWKDFYMAWGVLDVWVGLVVQFQERYMLKAFVVYCTITAFLPPLAQYNWDASKLKESDIGLSSLVLLALVIFFVLNRRFIVYKSRRQIRGDQKMYDDCWKDLLSREQTEQLLSSLKITCGWVRPQPALQLKIFDALCEVESTILDPLESVLRRQKNSSFARTYLKRSKLTVMRQDREIESLDQLYAQAILLEPMFLSKVQSWAEASDGCFQGLEGSLIRWRECAEEAEKASQVKWASIKNANRAIEKLVRSYFGRVSKLTDVVRQTIVFKELRQLVECVEVIINDPEVEVVRIKNRLDPDYDASTSGGYRDVGINLRVIHEGAKRWGVAGHVCELQLLLEEFVALKSAEGHKRYVIFRNSRCE